MSGYKRATITITRDEYDRLNDAEHKLRDVAPMPQPVAERIHEQTNNAILGSVKQIQERQSLYENMLVELDRSIGQISTASSRELLAFQERTLAEAQQYAGNLWEHVDRLIQAQNNYISTTIQQNQVRNQEEISQIAARVADQVDRVERQQENALEWLNTIRTMYGFLAQNYAWDFFQPGSRDDLSRQIIQAEQNYAAQLFEATISSAQQAYFKLFRVQITLEQQQNQWNLLFLANWESLNQILAYAEENEYVQAYDLEGSPLPYTVNVDFWTGGKLSALTERMSALLDELNSTEKSFTIEALKACRDEWLPNLYQELSQIIFDARVSALNSQLRINIADLVVQALRRQGFFADTFHYVGEDGRLGYQAHLVNATGNEVLVNVNPTGTGLGENELQLESADRAVRTEHELRQRWQEIHGSLSSFGLSVGSYVQDRSVPNRTGSEPRVQRERIRQTQESRGRRV